MSRFKKTWVSLQMISFGSLMIINDRTFSSSGGGAVSAGSSRCINEDELHNRADKFRKSYWDKLSVTTNLLPLWDKWTCAQIAKGMRSELSNRSMSPWKYSLDRDIDRFPHEIAFAECLCQGCIINQREELSYNSVPVFAPLMVLRKTQCPRDPNKYVVKKDFIKLPVACTCVVPKYAK